MADLNKNISQSNDMPDYGQEQLVQGMDKVKEAIESGQEVIDSQKNQAIETIQDQTQVSLEEIRKVTESQYSNNEIVGLVATKMSEVVFDFIDKVVNPLTIAFKDSGSISTSEVTRRIAIPKKIQDAQISRGFYTDISSKNKYDLNRLILIIQTLVAKGSLSVSKNIEDMDLDDYIQIFNKLTNDGETLTTLSRLVQDIYDNLSDTQKSQVSGILAVNNDLEDAISQYKTFNLAPSDIQDQMDGGEAKKYIAQEVQKANKSGGNQAILDFILKNIVPLQNEIRYTAEARDRVLEILSNQNALNTSTLNWESISVSEDSMSAFDASDDELREFQEDLTTYNEGLKSIENTNESLSNYIEFLKDATGNIDNIRKNIDTISNDLRAKNDFDSLGLFDAYRSKLENSRFVKGDQSFEAYKEIQSLNSQIKQFSSTINLIPAALGLAQSTINQDVAASAMKFYEQMVDARDSKDFNAFNAAIAGYIEFVNNLSKSTKDTKKIRKRVWASLDKYMLPDELKTFISVDEKVASGQQDDLTDEQKDIYSKYANASDQVYAPLENVVQYSIQRSNRIRDFMRMLQDYNTRVSSKDKFSNPARVDINDPTAFKTMQEYEAAKKSLNTLDPTYLKQIAKVWEKDMGPFLDIIGEIDLTDINPKYRGLQQNLQEAKRTGNYLQGEFGLEIFLDTIDLIANNQKYLLDALDSRAKINPKLEQFNSMLDSVPPGTEVYISKILKPLVTSVRGAADLESGAAESTLDKYISAFPNLITELNTLVALAGDAEYREDAELTRKIYKLIKDTIKDNPGEIETIVQEFASAFDTEKKLFEARQRSSAIETISTRLGQLYEKDPGKAEGFIKRLQASSQDFTGESFSEDSIRQAIGAIATQELSGFAQEITETLASLLQEDTFETVPDVSEELLDFSSEELPDLGDDSDQDSVDTTLNIEVTDPFEVQADSGSAFKIKTFSKETSDQARDIINAKGKDELISRLSQYRNEKRFKLIVAADPDLAKQFPTQAEAEKLSYDQLFEILGKLEKAYNTGLALQSVNKNKPDESRQQYITQIKEWRALLNLSEDQIKTLDPKQRNAVVGSTDTADKTTLRKWQSTLEALYKKLNPEEDEPDIADKNELNAALSRIERAKLNLDRKQQQYREYTGYNDDSSGSFNKIAKQLDELRVSVVNALKGETPLVSGSAKESLYQINTALLSLDNVVSNAKKSYTQTADELQQEKYRQQLKDIAQRLQKTAQVLSAYSSDPEGAQKQIDAVKAEFAKVWDQVQNREATASIDLNLAKAKGKLQDLEIQAHQLKEEFKETPSVLERIQSKIDAISSGLQRISSTLNSVTNIGRSMQGFFSNIWRGFTSGVSKIANFSKSILTANRATRSLTNTWTELNSKLAIFQRAYQAIFNNQYVTTAQSLMASLAGLNQISKDTANQIVSAAVRMEEAWGQSAASIIDSTSQIAIQLKSLGVQNKALANTSLMLSTIGMDMANRGLQGGDYQAIMNKIASGLRGETEAIIDVGVDVRASSLNELLKQIKRAPEQFGLTSEAVANLADTTSSLSETQLVYLRIFKIYQQQMQSYGTILGNLNSFMDTSVGRMAALRNAATTLFSTLGRALYEIVASIAPYIEYIIRLITAMINKFTAWLSQFSIFAEVSNSIAQANQNIGNAFNNTTGSIENNTEATQENTAATTQGSLASFDRIESLDSQSSALDAEADLSGLLDAIPNIQDLIDSAIEGESRVEQLGDKFKEAANDLRSAVEGWLSKTTGRKIDITFGMDFAKVSALLSFIGKKLYDTLKNVFGALAAYLAAVFDDIQIGKFLQNILTIIAILLTAINSFSQGLLGSVFGAVAPEGLKSFTQSLDDFITKNEYDQIFKQEAILDEQGNPVLDAEGNPLTRTVIDESKIPTFDQFFEDLAESYPKLATFFTNLATFFRQLADTAGALANALAPLIPQLITFASETLLPKLTEYLQIAGDWINNNTDKIQDFLTRLGEWGWETLQTVIEGIGKAIAYVVENPDTLFSVLDGISNVVGTVLSNPALSTFLGGLILFQDPLDALGESSELAFDGISTLLTGIQMLSNIKLGGLFGAGATGAGAAVAGTAGAGAPAGAGTAGAGAAAAAGAIPAGVIALGVIGAILAVINTLSKNPEVAENFNTSLQSLFDTLQSILDSQLVQGLIDAIDTASTALFDWLGLYVTGSVIGVIDIFNGLLTFLESFASFATGDIEGAVKSLLESAVLVIKGTIQPFVQPFEELVNRVIEKITGIPNAFSEATDGILSKITGWWDSIWNAKDEIKDQTTQHATGGIFNRAHFAQVAEDGPEAIIPLSPKYRSRALAIYGAAGDMLFGSSAMDITSQINSMTAIKSVPSIGSLNSNPAVSGVPPISQDDLFETIVNAIEAGGSGLINKLLSLGLLGSKGTGASQVPESQLLMQLAKLLAPYFVANASNIANTSFSM